MNKPAFNRAQKAYAKFLDEVLPGWEKNDNTKDTPRRVVKMFSQELFKGFNDPCNITTFDNEERYEGIVFQGNIEVKSMCSHHMMPFIGRAHVAYIPAPDGKIIGLSKLNRIVEMYSRRPQVQENLTNQIHDKLNELLIGNQGIAVFISANHTCVSHRGIGHQSEMKTSKLSGYFFRNEIGTRDEFYRMIEQLK